MKDKKVNEIDIQRNFYKKIADQYDKDNSAEVFSSSFDHHDHRLSLSLLAGLIDYLKIKSILDLGSGTGRSIKHLKKVTK